MTNKEAYEKYKKEAENFGGLTSKITNYVEELESLILEFYEHGYDRLKAERILNGNHN